MLVLPLADATERGVPAQQVVPFHLLPTPSPRSSYLFLSFPLNEAVFLWCYLQRSVGPRSCRHHGCCIFISSFVPLRTPTPCFLRCLINPP